MKRKIESAKGFTLAELLIVVAIIAVLVAIGIPIFTSQLEKSREAVDLSDVRSAYAEVMMAAITGDTTAIYTKDASQTIYDSQNNVYSITVKPLKQKQDDWQTALPITIGGVSSNDKEHWIDKPGANGQCRIVYTPAQGVTGDYVTFYWEGGENSGDTGTGGNTGTGEDNGNSGENGNNGTTDPSEPDNGNNSSIKKINDEFYANVAEFPDDNFTGILGNIYSYKGKLYICDWGQYFNVKGGETPDSNAATQFMEIKSNPKILTKDSMTKPWGEYGGSTLENVNSGDWYRDGDDYYICFAGSSYLSPPNSDNITTDGKRGNWVKINTLKTGNSGK